MKASLIIAMILMLSLHGLSQKKIAFEPTPVNFIIKNAGLNVYGTFGGLEGFITIDNYGSGITNIEGNIDPSTIQTGISFRDTHLKKGDYFNVKEFPKIFMTSTQITKTSNDKYVGNFNLTIKDVTKNIVVPFIFSLTENVYVLKGEFSINRLDFKLGEESIILSDDVRISIEFNANDK